MARTAEKIAILLGALFMIGIANAYPILTNAAFYMDGANISDISYATFTTATEVDSINIDHNFGTPTADAYGIDMNSQAGGIRITHSGNKSYALDIYENIATTETREAIVRIKQDHASQVREVLKIYNDGTGDSIYIDSNGAGDALNIDQAGANYAINIDQTGDYIAMRINNANDQRGLMVYSDRTSTADQELVKIQADNPAFDWPALVIDQDGVKEGLQIDMGGNYPHINLQGNSTVVSPKHGDIWTNGSHILVHLNGVTSTLAVNS